MALPGEGQNDDLVVYAYQEREGERPVLFFAREWEHGDHSAIHPVCILTDDDGAFGISLYSDVEELCRRIAEGSIRRVGSVPDLICDPNPAVPRD